MRGKKHSNQVSNKSPIVVTLVILPVAVVVRVESTTSIILIEVVVVIVIRLSKYKVSVLQVQHYVLIMLPT